jgi:hypothetical protein
MGISSRNLKGLVQELSGVENAMPASVPSKLDEAQPALLSGWETREDLDGAEVEVESTDITTEPFDPTQIRVGLWSPTVDLLMTRIRENEINLVPDFQRQGGLWSDFGQSRLIESILIRIPLPVFYMDATNEERLLVIDGNQRLTALKRFIIDQSLHLIGMEFLTDLHGNTYNDLPRQFQRRIAEAQVTVYLIEKGTPDSVKYNIFKRINTGGLPLSPQEIRHALNQGPSTTFLKELAESSEFILATQNAVSGRRMADRECVLRFMAFTMKSHTEYRSKDLDGFLSEAMSAINRIRESERNELSRRFRRAMQTAHDIFGNYTFRKYYSDPARRAGHINKALLEAWSVNLDARTDEELSLLIARRDRVQLEFANLLSSDEGFEASVSVGTAEPAKVNVRFERIKLLIDEVMR